MNRKHTIYLCNAEAGSFGGSCDDRGAVEESAYVVG